MRKLILLLLLLFALDVPAPDVTTCGTITQAGGIYTLRNDLHAQGGCMVFASTATGATLDLNGYTIYYGEAADGTPANPDFESCSGGIPAGWDVSAAPSSTCIVGDYYYRTAYLLNGEIVPGSHSFQMTFSSGETKSILSSPVSLAGGAIYVPQVRFLMPSSYRYVTTLTTANDQNIWRSTNGGTSFSRATPDFNGAEYQNAKAIAINRNNNYLYVIEDDEDVWRSTDRGVSWTKIASNFNGRAIVGSSLMDANRVKGAVVASDNSIIAIDEVSDVWRSTDGSTWTKVNDDFNGGEADNLNSMTINGNNIIFAISGTSSGSNVWRSSDFGSTWALVGGIAGLVTAIGADRSNNLIAFNDAKAVFRSTDNGASWPSIGTVSSTGGNIRQLVADSSNTLIILADGLGRGQISPDSEIFTSTNGGASWTRTNDDYNGNSGSQAASMAIASDNELFIASGPLYETSITGGNWFGAFARYPWLPSVTDSQSNIRRYTLLTNEAVSARFRISIIAPQGSTTPAYIDEVRLVPAMYYAVDAQYARGVKITNGNIVQVNDGFWLNNIWAAQNAEISYIHGTVKGLDSFNILHGSGHIHHNVFESRGVYSTSERQYVYAPVYIACSLINSFHDNQIYARSHAGAKLSGDVYNNYVQIDSRNSNGFGIFSESGCTAGMLVHHNTINAINGRGVGANDNDIVDSNIITATERSNQEYNPFANGLYLISYGIQTETDDNVTLTNNSITVRTNPMYGDAAGLRITGNVGLSRIMNNKVTVIKEQADNTRAVALWPAQENVAQPGLMGSLFKNNEFISNNYLIMAEAVSNAFLDSNTFRRGPNPIGFTSLYFRIATSNFTLLNSTLLDGASQEATFNCGSGCSYNVEWYLIVRAQDGSGNGIPGATVRITDSTGAVIVNGQSVASDGTYTRSLRQFTNAGTSGSGTKTYYTPHTVSVTSGTQTITKSLTMDRSFLEPFVFGPCTNGQTQSCITSQSCPGTMTCSGGTWGSCIDNSGDGCPAPSPSVVPSPSPSPSASPSASASPSVAPSPSPSPQPPAGNIFGNIYLTGTPRGVGAAKRCTLFTSNSNIYATAINAHFAGSSGTSCAFGVYQGGSDSLSMLLYSSSAFSVTSTTAAWRTQTIGSLYLPAGQYGLCVMCNGDWAYSSYEPPAGVMRGNSILSFETPFTSAGQWTGAYNTSIFVNITSGLPSASPSPSPSPLPDTTPAVLSNGAPTGTLPIGTATATLSLNTNEAATCRYSTTPNVAYASMTNTFTTTGGTSHSRSLTGLQNAQTYNYYVRCIDAAGNANPTDYAITFSVAGDTAAPSLSNGAPTGTLPQGTISTTLSLNTNEAATCRYSTTPNVAYSSMTNTFTTTGGTSHSRTLTGLQNGQSYNYYVRCIDTAENANTADYAISFSVAADTIPAILSNGLPTGTLPIGTTSATLSISTNEAATCRYSTTPNVAYSSMTNTFTTTGGTSHSRSLTGLQNGQSYAYYVRCIDTAGNANPTDYAISFSVATDTTSPAAITNLAASSSTDTQVTLQWTSPGDDGSAGIATSYDVRYSTSAITAANFGGAIPATGEPSPQVAGSTESYTVSGLSASTTYYFAIKTADEIPNWSALSNVITRTTNPTPDTTAPVLSNPRPARNYIFPSGTTSTVIGFDTNEPASCRFSTVQGVPYNSMTSSFIATGNSHSATVSSLQNGQSYNYYARCIDTSGNLNNSDYPLSFSIALPTQDLNPDVYLNSPSSGATAYRESMLFNCSAIDDAALASLEMYGNFFGEWGIIGNYPVSGKQATATYNIDLSLVPAGTYRWNCRATDNATHQSFAASNFSLMLIDRIYDFMLSPAIDAFSASNDPGTVTNRTYTLRNTGNQYLSGFSCTASESWVSIFNCPVGLQPGNSSIVIASYSTGSLPEGAHAVSLNFSQPNADFRLASVNVNVTSAPYNPIPVISNVSNSTSYSSVIISWNTDINSNSTVLFGTSNASLDKNSSINDNVLLHSINIQGLSPQTHYYFRVESCSLGGCSSSALFDFMTLPLPSGCAYSNPACPSGYSCQSNACVANYVPPSGPGSVYSPPSYYPESSPSAKPSASPTATNASSVQQFIEVSLEIEERLPEIDFDTEGQQDIADMLAQAKELQRQGRTEQALVLLGKAREKLKQTIEDSKTERAGFTWQIVAMLSVMFLALLIYYVKKTHFKITELQGIKSAPPEEKKPGASVSGSYEETLK
ncbi:MAG: fibronectin type III domain-containing protein [Candidatus Micrarchaeota archaeon]